MNSSLMRKVMKIMVEKRTLPIKQIIRTIEDRRAVIAHWTIVQVGKVVKVTVTLPQD